MPEAGRGVCNGGVDEGVGVGVKERRGGRGRVVWVGRMRNCECSKRRAVLWTAVSPDSGFKFQNIKRCNEIRVSIFGESSPVA